MLEGLFSFFGEKACKKQMTKQVVFVFFQVKP